VQGERRIEPFALSGITLLEIALLGPGPQRRAPNAEALLELLRDNPAVEILPLTIDIAKDARAIRHAIADPADRAIVATARVHGLTLLTSDERIVDSKLVPVID
jgi:PIN domain nuclease of toxin-antitoxin system